MMRLNERHSLYVTQSAFRFTKKRVGFRSETAQFQPEIVRWFEKMRDIDDQYQDARDDRMALTSEIDYREGTLSDVIRQMAREARAMVGGKTSDPRFTKLFTVTPTELCRNVTGKDEMRIISNIVHRLENESEYASLKPHAQAIHGELDILSDLHQKRRAAWQAEERLLADRAQIVKDAQTYYNELYAKILNIWPNNLKIVESIFYSLKRPKNNQKKDEAEEER